MKGLRSRAQRQHSAAHVRHGLQMANARRHRVALGKRLQLPTDKQQLRTEAERLVAEYQAKQQH
jgi:hypothetical protein